ncbi:iron chelate uptake ABC transporter family permease subunit [Shimia thalassica]|uniref:ABC transporter permease n=1 Tax=Shimia thalassica TaxID=1715693 RepID=UPI0027360D08|nr:iron chelate uptake ABC transporter family permease subunit [Shimia thalassica]MDP2579972.1 iron chelate uptake ABC transporter family permease subunit [Shimia thalassica]
MKRKPVFWVPLFGTALLAVLSLFVGVIQISPSQVFSDAETLKLVFDSRFPRTAAAVIAGATLSVAGLIMQMLVRNRFVEPMTAGTGQGAALGILIASVVFPSSSIQVKMLLACSVALFTSLGFLAIVRRLPPTQPLLVPLVGMVYGGVLGASVTFVAYQADLLQYIDIWMNGEFSGVMRGRYELLWIAAAVAVAAYFVADQFAIAGLGKEASLNLGLNYNQIVMLGLVVISIVSALTVVTVGLIPFVGLVVPNIVSRRFGDNLRATMPLTALMGAALVLASDVLGRILRHPFEIPVGTILGILGAGVFLWLLYARPRNV